MAGNKYFRVVLPLDSLHSMEELSFENCSLETVEDFNWVLACRSLSSLTRLHLDIGPALPEAISTIKSLKSLKIEHDHACSQAEWLDSMTNLTQFVVGGKERILRSVRPAAI